MTEWDSEKDSERVNKNDGWVIENRNKRGASEWEKGSKGKQKKWMGDREGNDSVKRKKFMLG